MSSIVTGSLWSPQEQDEQRSGSGVDILANCPTFCQTSMALRELARKGAGLVARVESQPALQTFARAMTAKVNQVTGAPMELYEKRKAVHNKRIDGPFRRFKWFVMLVTLTINDINSY